MKSPLEPGFLLLTPNSGENENPTSANTAHPLLTIAHLKLKTTKGMLIKLYSVLLIQVHRIWLVGQPVHVSEVRCHMKVKAEN